MWKKLREEKGNAAERSAMEWKKEGREESLYSVKRDGRVAQRDERVAKEAARKG